MRTLRGGLRALALAGVLVLGSCARDEAPPPYTSPAEAYPPGPAAPAAADLGAAVKASRPWRIAFVPKFKSLNEMRRLSVFWQPAWEGARDEGRELGVSVSLVASRDPASTDAGLVEPQIRLISNLVKYRDYDALVVAPFDSNRLVPVVERAVAAGIPTVAMDTPVNSDRLLTYVGFDNYTAGRRVGEWVVRRLGRPGTALILEGPRDQQNAVDRLNGFLAGLREGRIDVLGARPADWDEEPARAITEKWLREYPNVDAILAASDMMALGAAKAADAAGRTGIIITGFDATPQGREAVRSGVIAATVDQSPDVQARLAIELLVRHLERGEKFPPIMFLPAAPLVTRDTVDAPPSGQNGGTTP